jgi:hypothetical protein
VGSPTSSVSIDGHRDLCRHPRSSAWPARAREFVSLVRCVMATFFLPPLPQLGSRWFMMISSDICWSEASRWWPVVSTSRWLPLPNIIRFSVVLLFVVFFLCYLGFCFFFWETTVFEFVLVTLFTAVLFLDFNNVVTVLAIFWWLLQVSSRDAVGLVLISFPFTFITTLCGPLKESGHLFVSFPILCSYLYVVFVWFGSNVGEPTPFSLFGLTIFSFVRIRSGTDLPL